jgi:endonuclease-3
MDGFDGPPAPEDSMRSNDKTSGKDRVHRDKAIAFLKRVERFLAVHDIPEPAAETLKNEQDPYRVLFMTLLSLRTRDDVTLPASDRLFRAAPNLARLAEIDEESITEIIFPVGFYRTKAKTIKRIGEVLIKKFGGEIPKTLQELLSLPGVGLKTANLVLTVGHREEGLCVDIHVHRIVNRWGVVRTRNPDETYRVLSPSLPPLWKRKANKILVSFGQHLCRPVSPYCSKCPLSADCDRIEVDKHR